LQAIGEFPTVCDQLICCQTSLTVAQQHLITCVLA